MSSTCATCQVLQGRPLVVRKPSAQYSKEGQDTSPNASGNTRRAHMKAAQNMQNMGASKVSARHMAEARGVHFKAVTRVHKAGRTSAKVMVVAGGVHLKAATRVHKTQRTSAKVMAEARGVHLKAVARAQNPRRISASHMAEARGVHLKAAARAQETRRTSAVLMAEAGGVHFKAAAMAHKAQRTSAKVMEVGQDASTRIMLCLKSSQSYLLLASVLMGFSSAISTTTWTHQTRARRSEGRSCSLGQC